MTKHERALIRSCILDGFEFRNDMRTCLGVETANRDRFEDVSWDRFNAIMEEVELALDRQEPLMPFDVSGTLGFKMGRCGACLCEIDEGMEYCVQCGQKIKWEVDTDEQY